MTFRTDGRKYDGNWVNDMKSGQGTFYSDEYKTTSGIWKDDLPPNMGKIKFMLRTNIKCKHVKSQSWGIDFPKKDMIDNKIKKTFQGIFN